MTPIRKRMIEDMQLRNLSPHTQEAYVRAVAHFTKRTSCFRPRHSQPITCGSMCSSGKPV